LIRDVRQSDSAELADLLNAVIAKGGTTAHEEPFTPQTFRATFMTGPEVHCCFAAAHTATGRIEGFQALPRYAKCLEEIGDIATSARLDGARRGIGTALFAATCSQTRALGLLAINASIRADNAGGLAFYKKQGFIDHDVINGVPLKSGERVDRAVKRYTST
jgi:L-amino acid N-acyltransferase YncA